MKPCGHFEMIHKCRVCWLYENDSRYKSIWDGNGLVVSEQGTNVIVENKKKEVKETIEKMKSVVSKPKPACVAFQYNVSVATTSPVLFLTVVPSGEK